VTKQASRTLTGQESAHQYPFKAEDFATLVNRNGINREIVQMAAEKRRSRTDAQP
jgi:hypothetical protein